MSEALYPSRYPSRDHAIEKIRDALVHAVYPGLSIASAKVLLDEAWDALAFLAMEKPGE